MLASDLMSGGLLLDNTRTVRRTEADVPLGRAGTCPGCRRLFIVIFDDSYSVTAFDGADPNGQRYPQVRHAIRTLAAGCTCGREYVSVLHFDTDAALPGYLPPTSLRRTRAIMAAAHQPKHAGGSSDLGPSLTRAEQMAARFTGRRGSECELVIVSDVEWTDTDPQQVFERLGQFGQQFPGHVTAVVVGAVVNPMLAGLENVRVVPIAADDPPGTLARLFFDRLTTGRTGRYLIGGDQ